MNNTKFFKVLHLISSLVAIAVIATGAYFGYGFYKEYKAEQAAKIAKDLAPTEQAPKEQPTQTPQTPQQAQEEIIDWGKITASVQDTQTPQQPKPDEQQQEAPKPQAIKTLASPKAKKPKLAIIMDDMAYKSQLNDLQRLGLPITPSFFPVSPDSPDTAKLAASTPFYMVHLPLEAKVPQQSRQKWILVGSSQDEIRAYITAIKEQFPKLLFLNNHTGSKFTASKTDMANLLQVLGEFGIEFVDSRTSADTAVPALYKQDGRQLLARDVFLDNSPSVSYTTKQLKQAIAIAKKKGYAIAICHPHQSTFKALANAKHSLFKEVELVYLKDLPIAKALLTHPSSAPAYLPISAQTLPKPESTLSTQAQNAQNDDIPHNAYLEGEMPAQSPESSFDTASQNHAQTDDKEAQDPKVSLTQASEAASQQAQAPAPQATQAQTPPIKEPKPSQIDTTMFKEAKRVRKEQEAKAKAKAQPKPKAQSPKPTTKTYESSQDCAQNEVEAFVSGCSSDKAKKKQQGFINIKWHNDEQNPSKKPKDFLDSSEF